MKNNITCGAFPGQMRIAGLSTGCLYKQQLSLTRVLELYSNAGANAVEICLAERKDVENFAHKGLEDCLGMLSRFKYVSLHAPFKGSAYVHSFDETMDYLSDICSKTKIGGIVLHPTEMAEFKPAEARDFSRLERYNLPFLIENMDKNKEFGKDAKYFERLMRQCSFGFVLDIFHAYENDPSMRRAQEMLAVMEGRIAEIHMSGVQDRLRHRPAYSSDNSRQISEFLEKCPFVPIISEGLVAEKNFFSPLMREMRFLEDM
jgi:hypothetical protein